MNVFIMTSDKAQMKLQRMYTVVIAVAVVAKVYMYRCANVS